jgi:hypothetical protein
MTEVKVRPRYLVREYANEWQVWDTVKLMEHSLHVTEAEAKAEAKQLNGR